MTLKDCGQSYIDAVMADFPPSQVHLNTPVSSVSTRPDGKVHVQLAGNHNETYDHVILACHGDEALSLLCNPTTLEANILSNFQTTPNHAILHSDLSLMPRNRRTWSSWNYLTLSAPGRANIDKVSLTYNMNILQDIPTSQFGDVLVTLNPLLEPDAATVQGSYEYRHPLYTAAAVRAQRRLKEIQNTRGISFAGAWTGYGFHEDGISSGLRVATEHLGANLPFEWVDSTYSRGRRPELGLMGRVLRLVLLVVWFVIWVMEGMWENTVELALGVKAKSE